MKISVFIPCVPNHWPNIKNIVNAYNCGSVVPDEIVILLSDCGKVKNYHIPGSVTIAIERPLYAGPARQRAVNLCRGDIIMYNDADDLPHKDRVKIVKDVFEKNSDIMVLSHSYDYKEWSNGDVSKYKMYDAYNLLYEECFKDSDFMNCSVRGSFGDCAGFPVHAGVPCIRRDVLKVISWKHPKDLIVAPDPKTKTEDFEFCFECLYKYKHQHAIIDSKIYLYTG